MFRWTCDDCPIPSLMFPIHENHERYTYTMFIDDIGQVNNGLYFESMDYGSLEFAE